MRVRGQSMEAWSEDCLVTGNRTDMGWLIKFYDLTNPIWPCKGTFYSLGKGTWLFNDKQQQEDVSTIRRLPEKPVFGSENYINLLRRKKS